MMIKNNYSSLIHQLEQAFCVLPGVGPKSASRMAYHLLLHARKEAGVLSNTLAKALENIGHCQFCQTLTEHELCHLCQSNTREKKTLCVVANPHDIDTIEQSQMFHGRYFVLKGLLSPIDGIGPNDVGFDKLLAIVEKNTIDEVILALSPTVEGEATIHYIKQKLKDKVKCLTRLASGVPVGGELAYVSANTIGQALYARAPLEVD